MQWLHLLFAGTTKFEIHGAKPVGGTQRVGGVAVFPEKKGNLRTGLSLWISRVCGGVGEGATIQSQKKSAIISYPMCIVNPNHCQL